MTPRYRLRTLLIVLALGPPLLWLGWGKYQAWREEQARLKALAELRDGTSSELITEEVEVSPLLFGTQAPGPQRDSSDLEHGKGP